MKNKKTVKIALIGLDLLVLVFFVYSISLYSRHYVDTADLSSISQLAQVSPLETGLVAWWKFDEESGSTAIDSSGNGHPGSLVGDPVRTGGKISGALTFDGTNNVSVSPIAWPSGDYATLSIWIKTTSTASDKTIVRFMQSGNSNSGFGLGLGPNGGATYSSTFCINNTRCPSAPLSNVLNDGEWHMLTGVYDKSLANANVKFYIDGVSRATPGDYTVGITGTDLSAYIAKVYTSDGFIGSMDDVRLYDRALSAQEVQDLYSQGLSQVTTKALIVTKSGDGTGTVSGGSINCGLTCNLFSESALTVELQAVPDSGSVFSGWSGDCSGTGACSVTLDGDRNVTATFSPASGMLFKIVPPMSSTKILPDTVTFPGSLTDILTVNAARGEYEPASFVIRPDQDLSNVMITASALQSGSNQITADNVDIKSVKVWYQSGPRGWTSDEAQELTRKIPTLVPELMLNDDSLVRVDTVNQRNAIKLTTGSYYDVSDPTDTEITSITQAEFPVQDAATLQPLSLAAGKAKQFWITVKVPESAPSGTYTGTLDVSVDGATVKTLTLVVNVRSFDLQETDKIHSLYYSGYYYPGWAPEIDDQTKTEVQYRAELLNMKNHGVKNPQIQIDASCLSCYRIDVPIRAELGMNDGPLYAVIGNMDYPPETGLDVMIPGLLTIARENGFSGVYAYGFDEIIRSDPAARDALVARERAYFDTVHQYGGNTFVTTYGLTADNVWGNTFGLLGETLDLAIDGRRKQPAYAAAWHSIGKKIVSYADPQVGVESPYMNRANAGVAVWATDYDGTMDFAYQAGFGKIWNDFDSSDFRDGAFAYPTINGVIDTIGWEGFREAYDDLRYIKTLENSIAAAQAGSDSAKKTTASQAQSYLNNLKSTVVAGLGSGTYSNVSIDLDVMRETIAGYIASLGNGAPVVIVPTLPSVSSFSATSIGQTSATINGSISSTGNDSITQHGFAWGTSATLGTGTATTSLGTRSSAGSFSSSLTSLTCDTDYYFRAYAANSEGITYGSILTLQTSTCSGEEPPSSPTTAPTVSTSAASSITTTSAVLNGSITSAGGENATQHGFAWGTSSSLSTAATTTGGSFSGTGAFTSSSARNLSSLTCNTAYYFRPYATNSAGTGFGTIISFTTSACGGGGTTPPPGGGGGDWIAPTIFGGSPSGNLSSGTTQATLKVTTNENATCKYGTTANIPYASMTNTFSSTGSTNHSSVITGLSNSTSYSYYVRCRDGAGNVNSSDYLISFKVAKTGGSAYAPGQEKKIKYPTITSNLSLGSTGSQVTLLQEVMVDEKFMTSTSTTYGIPTQSAVASFQKKYGIVSTGSPNTTGLGNLGPRTRGEVNRRLLSGQYPRLGMEDTGASLASVSGGSFTRSLKIGSTGADVKSLQTFLNGHGFTVSRSGAGSPGNETSYFGPATAAAVKRFQEFYASEVLAPSGLSNGTGFFGPATLKKINSMQ